MDQRLHLPAPPAFRNQVHAAIAATGVRERLTARTLVWERIARGGGRTEWYWCRDPSKLDAIEPWLSPGSRVAFYVDGGLGPAPLSTELTAALEHMIDEVGAVVVGVPSGIDLAAEIIESRAELADYLATLAPDSQLVYMDFPARGDHGARAIEVTLPDHDGVVRSHPH